MVKFASRFFTHTGCPTRGVFKLRYDIDTGAEELVRVGTENFQAFIQASRDSCDINTVIARVRAGEANLLNQVSGLYGDFTGIPTTVQEIMQTRIDARRMFDNLPKDRKDKFESFEDFCANAGTVKWLEQLGFDMSEFMEAEKSDGDKNEKESDVNAAS